MLSWGKNPIFRIIKKSLKYLFQAVNFIKERENSDLEQNPKILDLLIFKPKKKIQTTKILTSLKILGITLHKSEEQNIQE
jgi:hypothetical protein